MKCQSCGQEIPQSTIGLFNEYVEAIMQHLGEHGPTNLNGFVESLNYQRDMIHQCLLMLREEGLIDSFFHVDDAVRLYCITPQGIAELGE